MANFCAKCGTPLAKGARFCTACGEPVREPEMMPEEAVQHQEDAEPEDAGTSEGAGEQEESEASEGSGAAGTEASEASGDQSSGESGTGEEAADEMTGKPDAEQAPVTPGAGVDMAQIRRFVPAMAVFAVLMIIIIVSAFRGYRKPIKQFEKALNRKNAKLMSEAVFDETMDEDDWRRSLESQFGEDAGFDAIKVKIHIDGNENMNPETLRDQYNYLDEETLDDMKKARIVETDATWTMTYHEKDLKFDVDMDFVVVKYKGDWKIIDANMNSMYEEMVNALNKY